MDHLEDAHVALQLVVGETDGAHDVPILPRDQVVGVLRLDLEETVVERQRPEDLAPAHPAALDTQQVGVAVGRQLLDFEALDVRIRSRLLVDDDVGV